MTVPRSTLRLQFHRGFTFDDALAHVEYFAALGVSHLYSSPITAAVPGSMHGYDTVDYAQVKPESAARRRQELADDCAARQMGLIVESCRTIWASPVPVPQRMVADILEWGRHSTYARHSTSIGIRRILRCAARSSLPCLGAPYGEELAAGRIALRSMPSRAAFSSSYAEHRFPGSAPSTSQIRAASGMPSLRRIRRGRAQLRWPSASTA